MSYSVIPSDHGGDETPMAMATHSTGWQADLRKAGVRLSEAPGARELLYLVAPLQPGSVQVTHSSTDARQ